MNGFELKTAELPQESVDINDYLNRLFAEGTKPYEQLADELRREFRPGGSPDVDNLRIDRAQYDAGLKTGKFRVVLDIDFTFGCEDVRTQKHNETSEWQFKVDAAKGIIHFEGSPYAESRSTADEF